MTSQIIPAPQKSPLTQQQQALAHVGQIANKLITWYVSPKIQNVPTWPG